MLVVSVPGALEVPLGLLNLGNSDEFDALIAVGTIIKGETYHSKWCATKVPPV